tara:strand:+ start:1650 stop:1922 length:273 start_codon:yes stop_codon:yes gene_type:complete
MNWQDAVYSMLVENDKAAKINALRAKKDSLLAVTQPTKSEIMALKHIHNKLQGMGTLSDAPQERRKKIRRRKGPSRGEEAGGRRSTDAPI